MASEELFKKIELLIQPIPPDTISTLKEELVENINKEMKEKGFSNQEGLEVTIERTLPFAEGVALGLVIRCVTKITWDVYKEVILPLLKRKYKIIEEKESKRTTKK